MIIDPNCLTRLEALATVRALEREEQSVRLSGADRTSTVACKVYYLLLGLLLMGAISVICYGAIKGQFQAIGEFVIKERQWEFPAACILGMAIKWLKEKKEYPERMAQNMPVVSPPPEDKNTPIELPPAGQAHALPFFGSEVETLRGIMLPQQRS